MRSSRLEITMGREHKTKAIQADLGILESSVTLANSKPRYIQNQRHTQNPAIFGTLAYSQTEACSEPCFIHKPGIFRTRAIFRTLVCSGPFKAIALESFAKIVNSYNYFRSISFSRSLLYEINIMNFVDTSSLVFT